VAEEQDAAVAAAAWDVAEVEVWGEIEAEWGMVEKQVVVAS
jgi:hypothetical protein